MATLFYYLLYSSQDDFLSPFHTENCPVQVTFKNNFHKIEHVENSKRDFQKW